MRVSQSVLKLRNLRLRIYPSILKMLRERLQIKTLNMLLAAATSHFSVLMSEISKYEENIVWFDSLDMSYLKIANCVNFSKNGRRKDCELLPLARKYGRKDCKF